VDRTELFEQGKPSKEDGNAADALASLQKYFDEDFETVAAQPPLTGVDGGQLEASTKTEFNLFSTGDGTRKISLSESSTEGLRHPSQRPVHHYLVDP
jgi:hypothetical protein